jgi:effector-binding domain-containing protein
LIVNPHDELLAGNVLSRKRTFHYDEWETHLSQFLQDVADMGITVRGPVFYSVNNIPVNEIVNAEFFISIEEDLVSADTDMIFRSYFGIEEMVSICLYDDPENRTEEAYARLLYHIQNNHLQQITPIFHVISGDEDFPYTMIKIGVQSKENNEIWK